MGKMKKVSVFLLFLTFFTMLRGAASDNLVITKDINFEVEIGTAIDLDLKPVIINFGNILRDNDDTITKTEYLKFNSAFLQDNMVTTSFPADDLSQSDQEYAKFELEYENKKDENYNDKLPVHIKRVKAMLVRQGEDKIPITAEIRGVPENQRLGKYYKAIKMDVTTSPINPIKSMRSSGEGGMK